MNFGVIELILRLGEHPNAPKKDGYGVPLAPYFITKRAFRRPQNKDLSAVSKSNLRARDSDTRYVTSPKGTNGTQNQAHIRASLAPLLKRF